MKNVTSPKIQPELQRIIDARHHDPFAVLGRHSQDKKVVVRAHLPYAEEVHIAEGNLPLQRIPHTDLFEWQGKPEQVPERYRLIWRDADHHEHIAHDPYCFPPQVPDFDLYLFGEGKHWHAYRFLGAHPHQADGVAGVLFAVWAPSAERVSVVGGFNRWDGRVHPMRVRGGSGVWELFIPNLSPGDLYKFEVRNRHSGAILLKSDPYGQQFELRPSTATIVTKPDTHAWQDAEWLEKRRNADWLHQPMSVYEVHLGSWRRGWEGEFLNYREMAHQLVEYVKELGFSHIELLPITEHPFDASWGYQTSGYYAPTSRFGTPEDFRYFVDYCHQHDIGVILDWVPAHFPKDASGLARFDGEALYEHTDPRKGEHLDWGTLIFNFGRYEVKNFLLSSALFWIEEYHLDGLRVDAVASMLYLDYSRKEGEWIPNKYGGRENLEAIDFMRELNTVVHSEHPGALVIAEESTSWPQVTRPTYLGGLGFSMKWNMGWMNDTLHYIAENPIHRRYHHDKLTFSMLYCFTENFMLPFSHDEVVHGKGSMINKMPGDEWQRFANLRLLYLYMFTHPGKKLLFMGTEFGQGTEWNSATVLDWYVIEYDFHKGMKQLVADLNRLYRDSPELHYYEFEWQGFSWIDCHDADQSILSYLRKKDDDFLVVLVNFTPVPRQGYRIGVPRSGRYTEIFNSDSHFYAGSGVGNGGIDLIAEDHPWMNHPYSITLTVPPLAGLVIKPDPLPEPVLIAAEEEEPLTAELAEAATSEEEVVEEQAAVAPATKTTAAPVRVADAEELAQPE
ncbi:MAG: 1,4-alpha-glucan branching protein GlgB [Candidatus Competibacteraceae bacterium]|nr:MAG: 1,4-alpha-glucan branching protein GlgB [Candidatus Competibacteraceae bacterium]